MHNKTTCFGSVPARELVRFLLVTVLVGTLTQRIGVSQGLAGGGRSWLLLTMWVPTLGALLAGPCARRMIWAAVKRPGFRFLGPALVIGFAPRLLQTLVLLLTGWGSWDSAHFELAPDGQSIASIHKVAMVLGTGPQSLSFFALNLLVSISLASVVTALVGGVGEEIGWRGFLQPLLESRVGATKATLLVGAIWSYWHLGANLSGYNDPQHPLLNALVLFPVAVTMMSFGFAWLARNGLSVWPVALAHGANNVLGSAFLLTTDDWLINASLEVGSMTLVAAFFVWFSSRARRRTEPEVRLGAIQPSA